MAVWSVVKTSELEGSKRLDAEYYRPEFLKAADELEQRGATHLGELLSDIRYGIYTEPDYLDEGTDFIRALNLEELAIEGEVLKVKPAVIPSAKYLLKAGDVLIVRSGANVGNAGVVVDRFSGATFGSYTIRIRLKDSINPFVFYVFLKSKFGRLQTVRFRTGLAQPNINIPNLRLLQVIGKFTELAEKEIEHLVRQSYQYVIDTSALYLKAERLVLDAIGWDKLNLSQSKWWAVPLSRANSTHRLDAEHFQPKYDKLVAHLRKAGRTKQLGEFVPFIKRGLQPDYSEAGEIIVVNSQHLGQHLLNMEATERTEGAFWDENKTARIEKGDLLMYATGAPYVGRTNWYLDGRKAVASNHVTILRATGSVALHGYLSVFLNSPVGMLQAAQHQKGSNQQELYPEDIARIWVVLPPEKVQQQVADLVKQSYSARQKAKTLLAEAKAKVETLIEGKRA